MGLQIIFSLIFASILIIIGLGIYRRIDNHYEKRGLDTWLPKLQSCKQCGKHGANFFLKCTSKHEEISGTDDYNQPTSYITIYSHQLFSKCKNCGWEIYRYEGPVLELSDGDVGKTKALTLDQVKHYLGQMALDETNFQGSVGTGILKFFALIFVLSGIATALFLLLSIING